VSDWDAATYDRVSDVQLEWALAQLERLPLDGDEVVLDAGCGSGRVTAELVRRLPRGRVYGVDASAAMVEHASASLGQAATILHQDLVELELPEPVDVVFSNATFHWVLDHDALFAALRRAMKPGARLVAQCGGAGNIDSFLTVADEIANQEPFSHSLDGWLHPWYFATPEDTAARLERAGFSEVHCWLGPGDVAPAEPRTFVETVCLRHHLDQLPAELRGQFVDRVLARCDEPLVLDYVRLNMSACRA
jgi:trans-aconitate 2-methyltransferase